jgi:hypothetical protein
MLVSRAFVFDYCLILGSVCSARGMFVQSARRVTEHRKNPEVELAK